MVGGLVTLALLASSFARAVAADPSPPPPSSVPASVAPSPAPLVFVSCGGHAYPGLGIDAPTDVLEGETPEADALRAILPLFEEHMTTRATGWRIAGQDGSGVLFLARWDDPSIPGWLFAEAHRTGLGWRPGSFGECEPRVVIAPDVGAADWWLDPAADPPSPDATVLQVLVLERACASGASAEGRIAEPVIVVTPTSVTVTMGVWRRVGDQSCQGNPPTPFVVVLPEPLGARELLDGGRQPPAPPMPPEGY
jgi:hypothetical protein